MKKQGIDEAVAAKSTDCWYRNGENSIENESEIRDMATIKGNTTARIVASNGKKA